jgi:hypothetical protein
MPALAGADRHSIVMRAPQPAIQVTKTDLCRLGVMLRLVIFDSSADRGLFEGTKYAATSTSHFI